MCRTPCDHDKVVVSPLQIATNWTCLMDWSTLQARNLVLCFWRSNISRYLSLEEVIASKSITPALKSYADIAWHFLNARGYINFGLSDAIRAETFKVLRGTVEPLGTVVILGAGLAGLGAAHQLLKFGYKVVEAKPHPGGRVFSQRLEVCTWWLHPREQASPFRILHFGFKGTPFLRPSRPNQSLPVKRVSYLIGLAAFRERVKRRWQTWAER
jgi:hypothetical protein